MMLRLQCEPRLRGSDVAHYWCITRMSIQWNLLKHLTEQRTVNIGFLICMIYKLGLVLREVSQS